MGKRSRQFEHAAATGFLVVLALALVIAASGGFGGPQVGQPGAEVGAFDGVIRATIEVRPPVFPKSLGRLWQDGGYRLATLRRGHGALVRDAPDGRVLGGLDDQTEFGSPRVFSVLKRRDEWLQVTIAAYDDNRPLWIRADPYSLDFSTTDVAIRADLAGRSLTYEVGGEVRRRMPMTVGAAGTETPSGRFAVSDVVRAKDGLDPVYGCCAVVLSAIQDDLPASWPGGNRVGIHGTRGAVGEAASLGCMRLGAADIAWLANHVPLGAPVFVS